MIAYKVIERGTRRCSNLAMFWTYRTDISIEEREAIIVKLETKYPTSFPRYRSNTWVRARRGSIGIMAFDTEVHAQDFIDDAFLGQYPTPTTTIVKVFGDEQMPSSPILMECGAFPGTLTTPANRRAAHQRAPIEGTLFFKKVFVLE